MKLHLIFFTKSTQGGGVQTLMKTLETEALKEGIEVDEIYHKTPWSELYEEIEGVEYVQLSPFFENFSFRMNFLWNSYLCKKRLKRSVGKNDQIIIFSPNYLIYIPKKVLKKNRVIMVQTNRADVFFSKHGQLILKKYGEFIDYLTVFTKYDKKRILKDYFKSEEKIKIIPRACILKTVSQEKSVGKKLIFIGRIMEGQKNISGLIKIMKMLPKDYILNIYGNGPEVEVEKVKNMIEGHENIIFHGPTKNVKERLEENNIFLMTSRYEGFGNTLIEARSQGLPIVAYDTFDSLKAIVENGESGYIIPFENKEKFVETIEKITNSPDIYKKMSRKAIEISDSTEYEKVMSKWKKLLLS